MSATLYQTELTSLASEAKRRFPEIKTAAEKALQDLKSITITSEQQLAADLRRRPEFIDAFLKACTTSNAKLAISGVNALQRLVISQGLPISRLDETLKAFSACNELGLDIQLKVLQALPSLVQNYAEELRGDLLGSALQVCAALQGAKVSTISAVAAATLQQIVASVFARVTEEDTHASIAAVATAPGEDGNVELRPAAHDAYRVFRDLALAAEGRSTQFVQLTTLSKEECLELIASCIQAKPQLMHTHQELSKIIRSSVLHIAAGCLTDNLSFTVTIRCIRILRLLILYFFAKFAAELEPAISLFTHTLEADSSPLWKRVLIMELLKDMFAENGLMIKVYAAYDQSNTKHAVVQDILAAFVRLSSEKPAVIGLGQQSTIPTGPSTSRDLSAEQIVADPVGGVAAMMSSFGVNEHNIQGISSAWSIPKSACYDQLDKSQAPTLPETYIYSLALDCLNGLADTLAKAVLPVTMQHKRISDAATEAITSATALVESCWPAVLATCSTFMNAALDDGYYRTLIKAYQRFAQVAGLLGLNTPRDALMTTLGKAAVPPQVLNAAIAEPAKSPVQDSPRVFSNPKHLLSIESLVSQASSLTSDKEKRSSSEQTRTTLTVRNLLCLRALLNLAIALGPALGSAFAVVVQVLRQADIILSGSPQQSLSRTNTNTSQQGEQTTPAHSFSTEVAAVEAAASRLLESTADYPDEAFQVVLHAFGDILHLHEGGVSETIPEEDEMLTPASPAKRSTIIPPASSEARGKSLRFALPKLGTLASLNVSRFVSSDPDASGWTYLTREVSSVATSSSILATARRSAADIICRLCAECIIEVSEQDEAERKDIQDRALSLLLRVITGIYEDDGQLTSADLEVQSHIINSIKVILEQSGDTLLAGWDKILVILSSTFESDQGIAMVQMDDNIMIDWSHLSHDFISLRLGRDAFSAIQLLVTDFFTQIPIQSSAAVIELLFRFMVQTEDLNLSLTAITVAWNVADHLFSIREDDAPSPEAIDDFAGIEKQITASSASSSTAQWTLLLVRLRQIVQRADKEPAKAAFSTLCTIIKNTASQLPIASWATIFRHIIVGIVADEADNKTWQDRALTAILLEGIAETLSQQIELLSDLPELVSAWTDLNSILIKLLNRRDLPTHTAVYSSLASILSQILSPTPIWRKATDTTIGTWLRYDPAHIRPTTDSNDVPLRAYVRSAAQLLRVREEGLSSSEAKFLAEELACIIVYTWQPIYSADLQSLSALQSEVLAVMQSIPQSIEGVPGHLLEMASNFVSMHLPPYDPTAWPNRPSYVALGAEAMSWTVRLINTHITAPGFVEQEAVYNALNALADVIEEKYATQVEHKGTWLWMRATQTAVMLATPILQQAQNAASEKRVRIWREYVRIACNVVRANGLESFQNADRTFDDEKNDIQASQALVQVLRPGLGSSWIPDEVLASYMQALFKASIVHAPEASELSHLESNALHELSVIRRGRVKKILPSRREHMSYECFSQLRAFASSDLTSPEQARIAKVAAPLLILRLALPIRAYIADQPLRGRRPQPLSELEELLYCFEQIKTLRLSTDGVREDLEQQAHLRYLRPLLVKAARVAGDQSCGTREVLEPLQDLLEALLCM